MRGEECAWLHLLELFPVPLHLGLKGIFFIEDRGHRRLPAVALNQELPNRYAYDDVNRVLITGAKPELSPRGFSGTITACFTGQQVKEDAQLWTWYQTGALSLNRGSS